MRSNHCTAIVQQILSLISKIEMSLSSGLILGNINAAENVFLAEETLIKITPRFKDQPLQLLSVAYFYN